jgi:bud emergence protein 1
MNQYGQSNTGLPMQGTNPPPTLVKIKVWFDEDNCVVIRMPPDFQYADLYKKLQERRQLEQGIKDDRPQELDVAYRDEVEGKLFRLQSDRDLQEALERNSKLTLNVKTLGR